MTWAAQVLAFPEKKFSAMVHLSHVCDDFEAFEGLYLFDAFWRSVKMIILCP
jgi:hypothetical protein